MGDIFDPLYELIGFLLAFFYELVPPHNLGISIVLLTCTVMLALFPLTAKQARSMIAMQKVQPEIRRIQQQHKDDRQKQNEEIMRFYQENRINPLAGCLPLLMQMPIFIALFGVLRNVQGSVPSSGSFTRLYTDICGSDPNACQEPAKGLHFLSMDLSVGALEVDGGFLEALPYFVLVALVVFTGWFQAHQTMARQKNSNTPANPQMQMIGRVMPVMFGVFSLNFASGLVLYFVASNSWRIGQQQLVLNKMYDKANAAPSPTRAVEAESRDVTEPPPTGGGKGVGKPDARAKPRANPNTSRRKRKKRKR